MYRLQSSMVKEVMISLSAICIQFLGLEIIFKYLTWAFLLLSYFSGFKCEIFLMNKKSCSFSKS